MDSSNGLNRESRDELLLEIRKTVKSEVKRGMRRKSWLKNILYMVIAGYLTLLMLVSAGVVEYIDPEERIALIKIKGVISSETVNSADILNPEIRSALKDKRVKHLVLQLNSPGGTPAQIS